MWNTLIFVKITYYYLGDLQNRTRRETKIWGWLKLAWSTQDRLRITLLSARTPSRPPVTSRPWPPCQKLNKFEDYPMRASTLLGPFFFSMRSFQVEFHAWCRCGVVVSCQHQWHSLLSWRYQPCIYWDDQWRWSLQTHIPWRYLNYCSVGHSSYMTMMNVQNAT